MRTSQKLIGLFLLAAMLLLTACGVEHAIAKDFHTSYSPKEMAKAIIASQTSIATMHPLTSDDEFFWNYISERYLIDITEVEILDGIILYAGGVIVDEIAVFLLADESDAPTVKELLLEYAQRRRIIFSSYAPIQAGILANSIVTIKGNHVVLIITEDPHGAEATFLSLFSDNPAYMPVDSRRFHYAVNLHEDVVDPVMSEETLPESADDKIMQQEEAHSADVAILETQNSDEISDYSVDEPIFQVENPSLIQPSLQEEVTLFHEPSIYENSDLLEDPSDGSVLSRKDPSNLTAMFPEDTAPIQSTAASSSDTYDHASILRAWTSGDTSQLTPLNRRILQEARGVINTVITDNMDELDKKFAILRWIITWSVYDPEFLSNSPTAQPNPNNDNPYGLFVDQLAICFGFTHTFQLFMDLLDIECITVHGYDFTGGRHVWNLVHIDGIWTAIDVTLEVTLHNPLGVGIEHVPESINHRHVNLSCDHLWDVRKHRWDRDAFPIAIGRD